MNNVENQNNVNVDSGLKALEVPCLVVPSDGSGNATGLNALADPIHYQVYELSKNNSKYGTNPNGKTWNECLAEKAHKDLDAYVSCLANEKQFPKGLKIVLSVVQIQDDSEKSDLECSGQKYQEQCNHRGRMSSCSRQRIFEGLKGLLSKLTYRLQTGLRPLFGVS